MSTIEPFLPHPDRDAGIPAADVGHGGPPPAPGFGVQGEEPDRVADAEPDDVPDDAPVLRHDTPFRTPDPGDLQHRG